MCYCTYCFDGKHIRKGGSLAALKMGVCEDEENSKSKPGLKTEKKSTPVSEQHYI